MFSNYEYVRTVNHICLYLKKLPRIENSLVAVLTRVSKIFFHNMYEYSFVPITMLLIDWF